MARELRIWVESADDREPLRGCVEGGRPFAGWLGLMAAVEAVLGDAASGQVPDEAARDARCVGLLRPGDVEETAGTTP